MNPELTLFTNLGVAGITLFIIWMMLKWFMEAIDKKDLALDKKDEYIKSIIEDFKTFQEKVIEAQRQVANHLDNLTSIIKEQRAYLEGIYEVNVQLRDQIKQRKYDKRRSH